MLRCSLCLCKQRWRVCHASNFGRRVAPHASTCGAADCSGLSLACVAFLAEPCNAPDSDRNAAPHAGRLPCADCAILHRRWRVRGSRAQCSGAAARARVSTLRSSGAPSVCLAAQRTVEVLSWRDVSASCCSRRHRHDRTVSPCGLSPCRDVASYRPGHQILCARAVRYLPAGTMWDRRAWPSATRVWRSALARALRGGALRSGACGEALSSRNNLWLALVIYPHEAVDRTTVQWRHIVGCYWRLVWARACAVRHGSVRESYRLCNNGERNDSRHAGRHAHFVCTGTRRKGRLDADLSIARQRACTLPKVVSALSQMHPRRHCAVAPFGSWLELTCGLAARRDMRALRDSRLCSGALRLCGIAPQSLSMPCGLAA